MEYDSTYFKDLSECSYFQDDLPETRLTAIGWLNAQREYSSGITAESFREKLFMLLLAPWEPGIFLGFQHCPLCGFCGEITRQNLEITVGNSNLFVPTSTELYVCPSLIYHYIEVHRYCPPSCFQQAVMDCPEMNSDSYFSLLGSFNIPSELFDSNPDSMEG